MAAVKKLPIADYQEELVRAVRENKCIVITGETGCGKTTQLPQYLHAEGFSKEGTIGVTQPRRMAAISVANRVAQEVGSALGRTVGYQVRFDDSTSPETKIKYMTDGCLLREFLDDPFLSAYSVVVLDEAHERSLSTDVLFGLVNDLLAKSDGIGGSRKTPLKVVVMSATLDEKKFSLFFDSCPTFTISGRVYPVSVEYCCPNDSFDDKKLTYLSQVSRVVMDIHLDHPAGDILIFVTGQHEIESTCDRLFKAAENIDYQYDVEDRRVRGLAILPLYGSLPSEQQQRVFLPAEKGVRRVIVSTNIAATSVTVDGVVYVIDSGYVKQLVYSPRTGLDSLDIVPISKSEAAQRAGRAGRTAPGQCYRLYSESFHSSLLENTVPEIQRSSLTSVILDLKCMGIVNVIEFQYLDSPEERMIAEALKQLYYFQAIDKDGNVTPLGKQLVKFPLQPSLSRVLLRSKQLCCEEAALPIISMLSVENVFIKPSSKKQIERAAAAHQSLAEAGGGTNDFATLLATYRMASESQNKRRWCSEHFVHWRAVKTAQSVCQQLSGILAHYQPQAIPDPDELTLPVSERLRQALCYGLFGSTARLAMGRRSFRTMDGHGTVAYVHPGSALFGREPSLDWVIFHEIVDTAKVYLRTICPIKYLWVKDLLPRLHEVDAYRLSSCEKRRQSVTESEGIVPDAKRPAQETEPEDDKGPELHDRAQAARERYLARKRKH